MKCRVLVWLMFLVSILSEQWWHNAITEITSTNMMDILGKDKLVIVKFFTPWCYYCQVMNPEYLKVHEYYKEHQHVQIAKINCQDEDNLCDYLGALGGYPSLWQFKPGSNKKSNKFRGARDFYDMSKWINEQAQQIEQSLYQNEQKQHQQYDRVSYCIRISESIFGMFEQMQNQNVHIEDKLDKLEQEVNQIQSRTWELIGLISLSNKQYYGLQAICMFMLGMVMAVCSFGLLMKLKKTHEFRSIPM